MRTLSGSCLCFISSSKLSSSSSCRSRSFSKLSSAALAPLQHNTIPRHLRAAGFCRLLTGLSISWQQLKRQLRTNSTLVCMRRRILRRSLPRCHRVQIRNLRCSQSRCHPLWGENHPRQLQSDPGSKHLSVPTWIEFFNQRRHRAGDGVSSDEEVVSQVSPRTFPNTETTSWTRFYASIWTHAWLWAWLWYPERRPPGRHPQRPLASPEECVSVLWRQSRSVLAWGWSGWWCDWGKSVGSQDPESAAQEASFRSFCSELRIWPSLSITGTGWGRLINVSQQLK